MGRQVIQHLRSKNIGDDNLPIAPSPNILEEGEIAINFLTNNESLYIKNDSGQIVNFRNEKYFIDYINRAISTPPSEINWLSLVYPIGAIYISTIATSPSDLFGFGEWERIEDMFLLAGGAQYTPGTTGGESAHTLTEEELAPHHHHHTPPMLTAEEDKVNGFTVGQATNKQYVRIASIDESDDAGNGQPHNNMPPYLSVYVWKRIL